MPKRKSQALIDSDSSKSSEESGSDLENVCIFNIISLLLSYSTPIFSMLKKSFSIHLGDIVLHAFDSNLSVTNITSRDMVF